MTQNNVQEQLLTTPQLIGLLSSYLILNSVLYLLGYWNVFHINIFEFASFSDLVTTTIQRITSQIFPLLCSAVIGRMIAESKKHQLNIGLADDSATRFLKKYWPIFITILSILLLQMAMLLPNKFGKWIGIAFLSLPIFFYLSKNTYFQSFPKRLGLAPQLFYIALLFSLFSFSWGSEEGHLMKSKQNYTISIKETPGVAYNLVGRGGQYIFLWQLDKNHLVVRRIENISEMVFSEHSKDK